MFSKNNIYLDDKRIIFILKKILNLLKIVLLLSLGAYAEGVSKNVFTSFFLLFLTDLQMLRSDCCGQCLIQTSLVSTNAHS